MRIIFFGSGEFGLPTLANLPNRHQVVAVVSQPDRPAGRHKIPTPTPIARFAHDHGLNLLKSENVNLPPFIDSLRALAVDAAVVIAFGQKLSPQLLESSGRLALNLHASLLPKYRGAAPINWAIINGEPLTGVSVIGLADRMDAGPIYAQISSPIDPLETAGQLHDRLAQLGPGVIEEVLADLAADRLNPQPQDESQATKAPKLSKADAWVNFDADAATVIACIHGLTPWPGVHVAWHRQADNKTQELILRRVAPQPDLSRIPSLRPDARPAPGTMLDPAHVAVRDGAIRLIEVQLPGGRPLSIQAFLRGHSLTPGDTLARLSAPSPQSRGGRGSG